VQNAEKRLGLQASDVSVFSELSPEFSQANNVISHICRSQNI
jgi:hypothetical protein